MTVSAEGGYDIRTILDEMREEYWHGLAEEQGEEKELLECLIFSLGGERYAFETQHASEVIRLPKLVRVPAVQSLIVGIFNLRGEITAAMDIRPMLGLGQPELAAAARVLVVKSEQFATGIIAEGALGVQGLSFADFEPCSGSERRFVRGHFNDADGMINLLDLEALLASPEILVGNKEA